MGVVAGTTRYTEAFTLDPIEIAIEIVFTERHQNVYLHDNLQLWTVVPLRLLLRTHHATWNSVPQLGASICIQVGRASTRWKAGGRFL